MLALTNNNYSELVSVAKLDSRPPGDKLTKLTLRAKLYEQCMTPCRRMRKMVKAPSLRRGVATTDRETVRCGARQEAWWQWHADAVDHRRAAAAARDDGMMGVQPDRYQVPTEGGADRRGSLARAARYQLWSCGSRKQHGWCARGARRAPWPLPGA